MKMLNSLKYPLIIIIYVLFFHSPAALAQLKVSNTAILNFNGAGEAQSTVIAPKLKQQCPSGRFLVSRDGLRPPSTGLVVSRDLDKPTMTPIQATFDAVPNAQDYSFGTNDHDLITLSNGDVLYITGAFSKRLLTPKPLWFDNTFRGTFGPGARSVILTWRSTDGGQTFQYLSEFDPATVENGLGAYPQFRWDNGNKVTSAPWDMGGTDGPLVKVFPGDVLYMTNWIVGYHPKPGGTGFVPDPNNPVNKTLLLTSKGGTSWTSAGVLEGGFWRLGMASALKSTSMQTPIAFGGSNSVFTGQKSAPMSYSFGAASNVPTGQWGWEGDDLGMLKKHIQAKIWACTIVARVHSASNTAVLVFPDTYPSRGNGCRVYFYDIDKDKFCEADPIVPEDGSAKSCVLHPTIIDSGTGPLLLYWYDMNGNTLKGKIRGRVIAGSGTYTNDFDISTDQDKPYSFDLTVANKYWYGDYHTAGGFVAAKTINRFQKIDVRTVRFFPMWVQPDQTIRYGEVSYSYMPNKLALVFSSPNFNRKIEIKHIRPELWKKSLHRVALKDVPAVKQQQQLNEYKQVKVRGEN